MSDFPNLFLGPGPVLTTFHEDSIGSKVGGAPIDATWKTANTAMFVPFNLWVPITAVALFVYNGSVVSDHIDLGIYDRVGTRIVSTGSTLQAGVSDLQIIAIAATMLGPGLFYFAFAGETVALRLIGHSFLFQTSKAQGILQMAAAFPLPANAVFATVTTLNTNVPVMGLSIRAVL